MEKEGDRRRRNSRQDGRAQRSRGARSNHENTPPLGGRVEGHVRLYGDRGRVVGGADRDTGTARLEREFERRRRHAFPGDAYQTSRGTHNHRGPQESRGKSSVGFEAGTQHLPTRRRNQDHRGGAPSPSPLPTLPHPRHVPPDVSVGGGVQACIWDAGSGIQKRTLVGRSRRVGSSPAYGRWGMHVTTTIARSSL